MSQRAYARRALAPRVPSLLLASQCAHFSGLVSREDVEHEPGGAAGADADGRRDGRERLCGQAAQLVHRHRVHALHRRPRPPPIRHEAHLVRYAAGSGSRHSKSASANVS